MADQMYRCAAAGELAHARHVVGQSINGEGKGACGSRVGLALPEMTGRALPV